MSGLKRTTKRYVRYALVANEGLTLSAGILNVTTTMTMGNVLTMSAGTLKGAALTIGAGGSIGGTTGTFDGVTLASDATLPTNMSLTFTNGLTLSGNHT